MVHLWTRCGGLLNVHVFRGVSVNVFPGSRGNNRDTSTFHRAAGIACRAVRIHLQPSPRHTIDVDYLLKHLGSSAATATVARRGSSDIINRNRAALSALLSKLFLFKARQSYLVAFTIDLTIHSRGTKIVPILLPLTQALGPWISRAFDQC